MMGTAQHTAEEVAKWFLAWAEVKDQTVTRKSLQALLYFAQAWHLADYDSPLFGEELEAWDQGIVVPTVWEYVNTLGDDNSDDPTISLAEDEIFDFSDFSDDLNQFLITIWNTFKNLTPEEMTKQIKIEYPWIGVKSTKENQVISTDDLGQFYKSIRWLNESGFLSKD